MPELAARIAETSAACVARLNHPDAQEIAARLRHHGVETARCTAEAVCVSEVPRTHAALATVKNTLEIPPGSTTFERVVMLHCGLVAMQQLGALAVPESVKALICDEAAYVAAAPEIEFRRYLVGSMRFAGLCKTLTLRRFPAGQFDWETGGIARSDVLGVSLRQLPSVLAFLGRRMRGIRPVFYSHLNPRRANRSLLEDEALRSYHRMAGALAQQPSVLGFAACSWFRSPSTHAVSPHLAWMSQVFLENGGMVVDAGYDDPDAGVLARSETRRRLYAAGTFKPRRGLVLWPRDAMLAWAERHPELQD